MSESGKSLLEAAVAAGLPEPEARRLERLAAHHGEQHAALRVVADFLHLGRSGTKADDQGAAKRLSAVHATARRLLEAVLAR